jgi:hypothetical protein
MRNFADFRPVNPATHPTHLPRHTRTRSSPAYHMAIVISSFFVFDAAASYFL